jgi:hypothetical protein
MHDFCGGKDIGEVGKKSDSSIFALICSANISALNIMTK